MAKMGILDIVLGQDELCFDNIHRFIVLLSQELRILAVPNSALFFDQFVDSRLT